MSLKKEVQWNVIAWVISSTISRPGEGSAGSGGAAMWEAETRTISLILRRLIDFKCTCNVGYENGCQKSRPIKIVN